jgi:hypothetical protein
MTDLELLKFAAKAAGYDVNFEDCIDAYEWFPKGYDENGDVISWWNPRNDDGDALRLAVKLHLDIFNYSEAGYVDVVDEHNRVTCISEDYGDDPFAATRRAILRAAAEIGEKMK